MEKNEIILSQNKDDLTLKKEEDKKILSSIFFKKYKPLELISHGNYNYIYKGINTENNEDVAIKLESRNTSSENQLLENEISFLYMLRHIPGVVKIITTGHTKKYNILIEPLLGSSLYTLYLEHNKNFNLKDICQISIQCIERLESVHNKGIIHCDIKPENFLIGLKDKRIIYLIDFGLSRKYRSDRTKNHIQFSITKTMIGTARYASRNAICGLQLSRRDDLESLSYTILYFLTKKLPWQGIKAKTLEKRYKKIYDKKEELEKWDKFKEIPEQIQNFIKYCKNLGFTEEPDYNLMKNLFNELMEKHKYEVDNNFSWIIDKSIIGSKMPEIFNRKKIPLIFKFMEKIEKKKMSLSVGDNIKYKFEFNKKNNNDNIDKKRSNSPINQIKEEKDELNNNIINDEERNSSSVHGVKQFKLGKYNNKEEEDENN